MEQGAENLPTRPLRKRIPLAPTQTVELLEAVERAEKKAGEKLHEQLEDAHAARYATPMKLLIWLLIGSLVFDTFIDYHGYGSPLAGLAAFFGGLSLLKGSKLILRLVALIVALLAAISLARITWACWYGYPSETGTKWVEVGSLHFLAFVVSPCVYLIAESILAFSALKLRKVEFWTKWMKITAAAIGLVTLVALAAQITIHHRENEIRRDLAGELAALRAWVLASGGRPNLDQKDAYLTQLLDSQKRIQKVIWKDRPVAFAPTYERLGETPSKAKGRPFHYSEWFRLPSGQWGKIELEVYPPEKP